MPVINAPEIENIVKAAIEHSKSYQHTYCTVEHLWLALCEHKGFSRSAETFGVEVDLLIQETKNYLSSLNAIKSASTNTQPKKTVVVLLK